MVTLHLTNNENNAIIDKILKEKNVLSMKVTGITDLRKYVTDEGGKLQHINNLILDLQAFSNNSDDDIYYSVEALRNMYNMRIIIIAMGYSENSILLGKFFSIGIYNIAIGNDNPELEENIRPCFTKEGKQYKDSVIFKLSQTLTQSGEKTIIKSKPTLIKSYITIGVCGIESHIGATHHAIAMTKYISKIGLKSCYLEANHHNKIESVKHSMTNAKVIDKMISGENIRIFPNVTDYIAILKQDFEVFVFDYGTITETLTKDFLTMDLRVIISGTKPWEMPNYIQFVGSIRGVKGINTIMNFTASEMIENLTDFLKAYGVTDVYFAKYAPDPFDEETNGEIYSQICKQIIDSKNGSIENSKSKKKKFFGR